VTCVCKAATCRETAYGKSSRLVRPYRRKFVSDSWTGRRLSWNTQRWRETACGSGAPTAEAFQPEQSVAFALKDVRAVEVRRHSSSRTAIFILVGVIVVLGAVLGLAVATESANGN
jgi:hypothetical protein